MWRSATGRHALLLLVAVVRAEESGCGKLVECTPNGTLAVSKGAEATDVGGKLGCPGTPSCSGHGKCHKVGDKAAPTAYTCKCDVGFFGKSCAHMKFDCASLTSCADCQDPANTRFCGWCADGRCSCDGPTWREVASGVDESEAGAWCRGCRSRRWSRRHYRCFQINVS